LDFARWIRREQSKTPARAVQDGLDLLNAATHFFYCSALAPIILGLILEFALSGGLVLSWRSVFPVLAVIGLFSCGYSLDLRAAEYDVAAWHEFPNARGGGRRPGEGA
jgi:hypothetical protein